MTYAYALLAAGVVLTACGYFGPEDEGTLMMIGLMMVGLSMYAAYQVGNFPLPFVG